jgi:hypothetical protein
MPHLLLALACSSPYREVCDNRLDDDGDRWIDCDDPDCAAHCDSDADGFVDAAFGGADCDDADPARSPGNVERCDGIDDDCDGLVDADDPDLDPAELVTLYADGDGDGVGKRSAAVCPGAPGYAPIGGDCDDGDPAVHPDAPEVCDAIDDDCDELVDLDDDDVLEDVVYADLDADGFGDPISAVLGCAGDGWIAQGGDCDDRHDTVHPGADEVCDGLDDDCDGVKGPDEDDGDGDGDPRCSDCDDADPARATTFDERCGDPGVDEDCDGLVDFDDPNLNVYTCGFCPPDDIGVYQGTPIHQEVYNPCVLDPTTEALCSDDPLDPDTNTSGKRLHRVSWRTDQGYWRDELFLFLPPGPGHENTKVRLWASYAGYRTISLGYANDDVLEFKCADQPDICFRDAQYEITYGVDLSQWVQVGPSDSIVSRLSVLLQHLALDDPNMGFERYLKPDGTPDWSKIVVAGWSGGGGQAAFLAQYEPVHSTILMSAPKDHREFPLSPVDWVAAPSVTPGCAQLATWHVQEPYSAPPEEILGRAWDLLGIPETTWDLDQHPLLPVPGGTYRVSQSLDESLLAPGCTAHSAVADDQCLRDTLFPGYLYLYCTAAQLDPSCAE